jgi:hypothetical protein
MRSEAVEIARSGKLLVVRAAGVVAAPVIGVKPNLTMWASPAMNT